MKNPLRRVLVGVVLLSIAVSHGLIASPIIFTYQGIGTGLINTTSFANADFTITPTADTANRQGSGSPWYSIVHDRACISINGVGVLDFTSSTRTFVNQNYGTCGFSRAGWAPWDLFNSDHDDAFATWDMTTSIRPTVSTGTLFQWWKLPVETTGGVLNFYDQYTRWTFDAVVVPEPTPVSLFEFAAVGLLLPARLYGLLVAVSGQKTPVSGCPPRK